MIELYEDIIKNCMIEGTRRYDAIWGIYYRWHKFTYYPYIDILCEHDSPIYSSTEHIDKCLFMNSFACDIRPEDYDSIQIPFKVILLIILGAGGLSFIIYWLINFINI